MLARVKLKIRGSTPHMDRVASDVMVRAWAVANPLEDTAGLCSGGALHHVL